MKINARIDRPGFYVSTDCDKNRIFDLIQILVCHADIVDKIPKFIRRQIVRLLLYGRYGKPKNEFAELTKPYNPKSAVIDGFAYSQRLGCLIYRLKTDDYNTLLLPEDCLLAVRKMDRFLNIKIFPLYSKRIIIPHISQIDNFLR